VDVRPSELDPYPRAERDLASAVLWDRSLHRSRRRRIRKAEARRTAPRQKGATLAAGAAILASPVLGPLAGAASASSAKPGVTKTEVAQKAAISGEKTWLLSFGDTGPAVAAVQQQLRITADGIFGPQTEGAVKTFQLNHGLAGTGIVDARTWAEIFGSKVLFYGDADASASSSVRSIPCSLARTISATREVLKTEWVMTIATGPRGRLTVTKKSREAIAITISGTIKAVYMNASKAVRVLRPTFLRARPADVPSTVATAAFAMAV
jgi:hypothetical protein